MDEPTKPVFEKAETPSILKEKRVHFNNNWDLVTTRDGRQTLKPRDRSKYTPGKR
jgi:hypothetical protein